MAILSCCVFAASCVAQQISPTQQLRDYGNKMVGGTWHQALPEDVAGVHTYKWALGNQYLLVYMRQQDESSALSSRCRDVKVSVAIGSPGVS